MKKINIKFTRKQLVLTLIIAICAGLYAVLSLIASVFVSSQKVQQSAKYWDTTGKSSMISVFLNSEKALSQTDILMLEYNLDNALVQSAIAAPNEDARVYTSAYSGKTAYTFYTDRAGSVSLDTYVVGGDFFRFHEHKLINGNYLNTDNVMQDYIVLDKDAAWKLFGAIDVAGMSISVNGIECTVAGVVENEAGYLAEEGGAKACVAYVPIALTGGSIDCYEIIFPNPVTDFAYDKIDEVFKSAVGSDGYHIMDNTERYTFISSIKRFSKSFTKGMSFDEIAYPYWENAAIGVENILDVLSFFRLVFVVIPAGIIIVAVIRFHPIRRMTSCVKRLVERFRR